MELHERLHGNMLGSVKGIMVWGNISQILRVRLVLDLEVRCLEVLGGSGEE